MNAGHGFADVLMESDGFQTMGESLFAHPVESKKSKARFHWADPVGWLIMTTLDALAKAVPLILENLL